MKPRRGHWVKPRSLVLYLETQNHPSTRDMALQVLIPYILNLVGVQISLKTAYKHILIFTKICSKLYINITFDSLYHELSILSSQLESIRTPVCLDKDLFKK